MVEEHSTDKKKQCGACGFPRTTMRRYDGNYRKVRGRKGQGTGKMKYLKEVPRKFRNQFRCENVYKKALPEKEKKKELHYATVPAKKLL